MMNINDHINIIHNPHFVGTKTEYINSALCILLQSGFNRGVAKIKATQAANKIFGVELYQKSCFETKNYKSATLKNHKTNAVLEPAFKNLAKAAGISIYEAREVIHILVPKLFDV